MLSVSSAACAAKPQGARLGTNCILTGDAQVTFSIRTSRVAIFFADQDLRSHKRRTPPRTPENEQMVFDRHRLRHHRAKTARLGQPAIKFGKLKFGSIYYRWHQLQQ